MPPKSNKKAQAGKADAKAAAKAAKKLAQEKKSGKKLDKAAVKGKGGAGGGQPGKGKGKADEDDLEAILEDFQKEWEAKHAVKEEIADGPPSRRANATLVACPTGNYLWCIGGEYFDGDRASFYNDTYRYSPEKDEWRRFTSPNSPGPRSAHAAVATPQKKIFIFGGEYSSPSQTSFHHWKDLWQYDVVTNEWEQIETKVRPSPRSGCRMALWKNWIVLFGGFYDLGVRTNYLSDTWAFDLTEYKWREITFPLTAQKPCARSGMSLLPCADGVVLSGGYAKMYEKGKKTKGVALEDTWMLRMDADPTKWKWEKRRKIGYAPSQRSGCSMTLWAAKGMGVSFGGVCDEERDEESLESVFYQDMFAYTLNSPGRWISLNLKKPKKKAGAGRRKAKAAAAAITYPTKEEREDGDGENDDEDDERMDGDDGSDAEREKVEAQLKVAEVAPPPPEPAAAVEDDDPDDPLRTVPHARYNTMIAVLKNTMYLYGGIYESESREFTLADFYSLNLEKLERFSCLRASGLDEEEWNESDEDDGSSGSDDDDDDESGAEDGERRKKRGGEEDEDEEMEGAEYVPEVEEEEEPEAYEDIEVDENGIVLSRAEKLARQEALTKQANTFLGVSRDAGRTAEDVLSTPQPGESLRQFYDRSREYWAGKAHSSSDNRGKMLRKDGFDKCQVKYNEYKPILEEIERIHAAAGLEAEDVKHGGGGGGAASAGAVGEGSRNRR